MKRLWVILILLIIFSCEDKKASFTFNDEWKNLRLNKVTSSWYDGRVTEENHFWNGNTVTILNQDNDTLYVQSYNDYGFRTKIITYAINITDGVVTENYPWYKGEYEYIDKWKMKKSTKTDLLTNEVSVIESNWSGMTRTFSWSTGGFNYSTEVIYNEFGRQLRTRSQNPSGMMGHDYEYMEDGRRLTKLTTINETTSSQCPERVDYLIEWDDNKYVWYSSPDKCANPIYRHKRVGEYNADYRNTKRTVDRYNSDNGEYEFWVENVYEYDDNNPFSVIR